MQPFPAIQLGLFLLCLVSKLHRYPIWSSCLASAAFRPTPLYLCLLILAPNNGKKRPSVPTKVALCLSFQFSWCRANDVSKQRHGHQLDGRLSVNFLSQSCEQRKDMCHSIRKRCAALWEGKNPYELCLAVSRTTTFCRLSWTSYEQCKRASANFWSCPLLDATRGSRMRGGFHRVFYNNL